MNLTDSIINQSLDRRIVEMLPEALLVEDLESKIILVNKSLLLLTGFNEDELTNGTGVDMMIAHEGRREFVTKRESYRSEESFEYETIVVRKDQSRFPGLIKVIPITDEQQQVIGHLIHLTDLTASRKQLDAIKESNERLRYFMEESLEAIIIHENGIIIDFNSAACKMFGYTAEELRGKEVLSLYDTSFHHEIKERVAKKQIMFDEWTGVKKDGTRFDIEVYSRHHTYYEKDVRVVSILDISKQKKTERELRSSQLLLNAAVEGTNVGIWEWNLITNQMTFNETWRKIHRMKQAEVPILFDDWKKTVYAEDLASLLEDLTNHLYGSTPIYHHIYRVESPSGELMVMEAKGKLVLDENRMPVRIVGTVIDITERQQMEDALREREAQLSTLIENREEAIWSVDDEKKLIRFNSTFANAYKELNDSEPYQGMLITQNMHEDLAHKWDEWYEKALHGESVKAVDGSILKGHEIFVEYSLNPILIDEGKILGVSVVGRDITRQKYYEKSLKEAKEAAEESNRIKSKFLANISHEIRTPMNGIIGFTDLLLESKVNSKQKEYLQIVRYSADSLLGLINDLLDISKIESGKLLLMSHVFDLRKLLEEIIRSFKAKAKQQELKIVAKIEKSVPRKVIGDELRLQQILVNLIGNAVKFSDHGKIYVRVKLERKTKDIATLHMEVEDFGIGIAKEKHQSIFSPFSQLDDPYTSKYGGTGLGLSIAKNLVHMMHGEIGVDSELGKGSKFFFTVQMQVPK